MLNAIQKSSNYPILLGNAPGIRDLRKELEIVAHSQAKVLITGESGVGKEIVARSIHEKSPRANGPFVAVNCAGIPETLLESELFGHVRGSFTGAHRDQSGKLESAVGGTVFLDEVGEMTLRMQGVFLRFLETGEIQKVGAERPTMAANVRVIAATNRRLQEHVADGRFREDLFYRLNVIHLMVPPLRERREDIPLLVDHMLRRFADAAAGNRTGPLGTEPRVETFSADAMDAMCRFSWPGNVRQLENVIHRLVVFGRNAVVQLADLPAEIAMPKPAANRVAGTQRTIADDLFDKLVEHRQSFWTAVYPLYMNREITRANVRDLVHKGLEEARGNYKIVLQMFNMDTGEYKRFLDFLRKHDCQLPFKDYRTNATVKARR